uniref:Uncharacterized protein n=1 Tax=Zea mays TaxID=4577 RepID=C4J7F0_MAIZE|nr:unknown [Zea mays]
MKKTVSNIGLAWKELQRKNKGDTLSEILQSNSLISEILQSNSLISDTTHTKSPKIGTLAVRLFLKLHETRKSLQVQGCSVERLVAFSITKTAPQHD